MRFKKGDFVYYRDKEGNTVPAIVKAVKKRVKISGNFLTGDKKVWVSPDNIILQSEDM